MATKVPLTSPLRHGVLAFLDALGFKGIWQRAEPTAVIDKFTHLLDQVRQANLYPVAADGLNVHLQAMSLSDTVVIACSSEADPAKFRESSQLVEEVASLIAVAHVTAGLLGGMVATRPPPLAYRGTVALGEYYLDPEVNLLLGPRQSMKRRSTRNSPRALSSGSFRVLMLCSRTARVQRLQKSRSLEL